MVLGHEITGEIIEKGRDVEFLNVGDLVSAPFNIACGRCRNCREGKTGICLNVNGNGAGGAFGYVDLGGWIGGQAEYVMALTRISTSSNFRTRTAHWRKLRI
jgi:glutathione-independent formaldehyde dehydrogenase